MNRQMRMRPLFLIVLFVLALGLVLGGRPFDPYLKAEETVEETRKVLSGETMFTGKAEPGTRIDVTVYHFPNGRDRIILYQARETVGSAGLYSIQVPLPLIGSQYVSLETEEERRVYEYIRYSESLSGQITGYQLNIYELLLQDGSLRPGGTP